MSFENRVETRLSATKDTVRMKSGRKLEGIAAPYGVRAKIGGPSGFEEQIARGAFRAILTGKPDVCFLRDHNPSLIMGRTSAGTLRLTETPQGLAFECDLPDTQAAEDLLASVERGDVAGCSFSFWSNPEDETWEMDGKTPVRTLRGFSKLKDVSAVTYPAYAQTELAARVEVIPAEVRSAAMQCVHADVNQFVEALFGEQTQRRRRLIDQVL